VTKYIQTNSKHPADDIGVCSDGAASYGGWFESQEGSIYEIIPQGGYPRPKCNPPGVQHRGSPSSYKTSLDRNAMVAPISDFCHSYAGQTVPNDTIHSWIKKYGPYGPYLAPAQRGANIQDKCRPPVSSSFRTKGVPIVGPQVR
jgi:hypothetical protein